MGIINLSKYFIVLAGAFLLADLGTRFILKYCLQNDIVDKPSERKLHLLAVPRLGGIAVFVAFQLVSFAVVIFFGDFFAESKLSPNWWYQFIFPATLLLVVGVLDDLYKLSPLVKLAGQVVAASLLIFHGTSLGHVSIFDFYPIVDYGVTLFWFLLVINAFNLIDGLDGLAGGLAVIAATGLFGIFMISSQVFPALLMLAFIGAIGGFLRHNFHPAKIFLGDSGSMFIGFALAAFTLCSPSKGSTVATLGACVLALGVPLLDTALAVWRRSLRKVFSRGSGVMSADMDHLHHRLIKRGFNQRKVALSLYALSASFVVIGLLSLLFSSYSHGIYLIAFTFGTYVLLRHLANVELWDSGTVIVRGISRPSSSVITTFLYPLADVFVMCLALFVSIHFATYHPSWSEYRTLFFSLAPVWVGLSFVAVGLAGTYQRVWSRARVSEFVYLVGSFAFGAVLSAGVSRFLGVQDAVVDLLLFTTLYFCLGAGMLTALRAIPRVIVDLMFMNSEGSGRAKEHQRHLLVVGADVLYLRNLKNFDFSNSDTVPFHIVGIVDADRNLRKRIVHGYRVLGTPEELPRILAEVEVDEIVLTRDSVGISRAELVRLAEQHGVHVKEWGVQERMLTSSSLGLRAELVKEHAPSTSHGIVEVHQEDVLHQKV